MTLTTDVNIQKVKLVKYVRMNGYRILIKLWLFLVLCAFVMAFIGVHFNVAIIAAAMILLVIALCICFVVGVALVEMFVLKVKRYTDNQVAKTYLKLVETENLK